MSTPPSPSAKTTIWRTTANGTVLVKTLAGLPYGTASIVHIEGLGQATRSGIQTTGSGANEAVVEVKYTLG